MIHFESSSLAPVQKVAGCWDGEHPHIPDHLRFDVAIEADSDTASIYYTHTCRHKVLFATAAVLFCSSSAQTN